MWTRCRRHARAGRPGRVSQHRHRGDTSTGCCLIARNPFRTDHENSLSINWRTLLARETRALSLPPAWKSFPFALLLSGSTISYRFPYQQSTSTFTATYATQHIITTTIPNAAGCGHRGRLTTNHRPSAMANGMSLLSITGFGSTRVREDLGVREFESCARRNRAPSDYESIRISK